MKSIFVGVDGGGSKTIAVCAKPDGTVVGVGRSGGSNHEGMGMAGAAASIRAAVEQAVSDAGASLDDIASLHAGLAGMDWPEDIAPMCAALRQSGLRAPLSVENDAFLIVRGGAEAGIGIGVGAGSGVCCCIIPPAGEPYVYGSYLDQGFDCSIAGRALLAVVREGDGRGPSTALTPAVLALAGCATIRELVFGRARGELRLSYDGVQRACFAAADQGDAVAVGILRDFAGVFVDAAVHLLSTRDLLGTPVPVVAAGSRFTRTGPVLFSLFADAILAAAPLAVPILSDQAPVLGALRGAFMSTGHHTPDIWRRVCATYATITDARSLV